jgi:periplasmic divalent cation tolerance protein
VSGVVSVYAIFGSDEEARRIGRAMVEERSAACVNILGPCHSIYRWQGEIEESAEVAAIFKAKASIAPELVRRITALHSYEVPAAVIWPIADLPEGYRLWIEQNSGG